MKRTIENWMEIFGKLPSPLTESAEYSIAQRVIGDLAGYRHTSKWRGDDAKGLANAMIAYARMCQEANLKV